jgi:hypothetical protein
VRRRLDPVLVCIYGPTTAQWGGWWWRQALAGGTGKAPTHSASSHVGSGRQAVRDVCNTANDVLVLHPFI